MGPNKQKQATPREALALNRNPAEEPPGNGLLILLEGCGIETGTWSNGSGARGAGAGLTGSSPLILT